jgi:hypothetical protein
MTFPERTGVHVRESVMLYACHPSPPSMNSFRMQHQVARCASSAPVDSTSVKVPSFTLPSMLRLPPRLTDARRVATPTVLAASVVAVAPVLTSPYKTTASHHSSNGSKAKRRTSRS